MTCGRSALPNALLWTLLDCSRSFGRFCSLRLHADKLAHTATITVRHNARNLSEQRVVLAQADVLAGFKFGPALPDDDRTARNQLPAEDFYAQPLCIRIAAVF